MKVLVCLFDFVPKNSFIHQQLGIESLFQLFLDKSFFFQNPSVDFSLREAELTFRHFRRSLCLESRPTFLSDIPGYDAFVLWPLNQCPHDRGEAERVLADALRFGSCQIQMGAEACFVLKGMPAELQTLPHFSRSVRSFNLTAPTAEMNSLKLSSPNRSFNRIESEETGLLTKYCNDRLKGESEATFFTMIPAPVQSYFPTLTQAQPANRGFSYQIPRYEMLDLSRFLIHASLDENDWKKVFEKINSYLSACPRKKVGMRNVQKVLRAMFVEKLQARTREYLQQPDAIDISYTVSRLVQHLEIVISQCRDEELVFAHGDLCFSNILLDRTSYEIKFVDPRGATTESECYLPIAYDFSKLSQCVFGQYDWIMAQNISRPEVPDQHAILRRELISLVNQYRVDLNLVRLGEASLFLSMLPLHKDQPHLHASMIRSAESVLQSYTGLSNAG